MGKASYVAEKFLKRVGLKEKFDSYSLSDMAMKEYGPYALELFKDDIKWEIIHNNYKMCVGLINWQSYFVLKDVYEWIFENQDQIKGNNILEVGCGAGFVACFLATLFPRKTVTAIDNDETVFYAAETLAKSLGIKNIVFKKADIRDLDNKKYDTVVCVRVAHYILYGGKKGRIVSDTYRNFAETLMKPAEDYAKSLAIVLNDNGTLFSYTRFNHCDYGQYALYKALNKHGINIVGNTFNEVTLKEAESEHIFGKCILVKNNISNTFDLDDYYNVLYQREKPINKGYHGAEAAFLYEYYAGDVLEQREGTTDDSENGYGKLWQVMARNKYKPQEVVIYYHTDTGVDLLKLCSEEEGKKAFDTCEIEIEEFY